MNRAVSRRAFLTGVAGAVALSRITHAQEVSTVTKRAEKLYRVAGSKEPNDLQFVSEGLWVLDQVDQPTNKAFLVKPADGSVIREIMTDALHASGITYGNGALWIGSTKGKNAQDPPKTLKVDPMTGKTLKSWITPGSGLYGRMSVERGDTPSGAHGLKWADGKYWMAVPAANKVFLMEPETGEIVRSIPGPGSTPRTHGMAVENNSSGSSTRTIAPSSSSTPKTARWFRRYSSAKRIPFLTGSTSIATVFSGIATRARGGCVNSSEGEIKSKNRRSSLLIS
jgi:hypothetical protein